MGRPKKDPNRRPTDQRILEAAEGEFGPLGFHGAALADIAATAGIRRPTLLYYFETKAALYSAVVERGFQGLTVAAAEGIAGAGTFEERLEAVVVNLTAFAAQRTPLMQIIARELIAPSPHAEMVSGALAQFVEALNAFVRSEGGDRIRAEIPLQEVALQLISGYLLRSVMRDRRDALWDSDADYTLALARRLLLN